MKKTSLIAILLCALAYAVLKYEYIFFNFNPEPGVILLRITGFIFLSVTVGLIVLICKNWTQERSWLGVLSVALIGFFSSICFFTNAPNEHFEKKGIEFVGKNFVQYSKVAKRVEKYINKEMDYQLPKDEQFLSYDKKVEIVEEDG